MNRLAHARRIGVVVGMLAVAWPAFAQVTATDAVPPGQRTGMIVGQVVDAGTGAPVAEAIVQLTLPKFANGPTAPKGRVMADGDGRFFFTDLPPGDYFIQATKDGYAPGAYGQRGASPQLQQLLTLADGERLTDVRLKVWKYGVIGGTVVDEAGEPVVGVAVRALLKNVVGGRTGYGDVAWLVPTTTTDDRGMFRFARLLPGTYVVAVPSTHTTMPVSAMEAPNADLRGELFFSGVPEVSPLGQPRTQQMGDAALLTPNSVLIPPPPSPAGRMAVYRTTFYPAAATAGAATAIAIEAGQERTDLAIALQPVPAVRIAGRLVTPDGSAPPPTTIRLIADRMVDVIVDPRSNGPADVGFQTVSGMSDGTGRFTLLDVPAGGYVIRQADDFLSRLARDGGIAYWISQPLTVGAQDLLNVTVELRPALRVAGRIEFHSGNTGTSAPPMRFTGATFETPHGEPGQFAVQGTQDARHSFFTVAPGGQYIVRPVETAGWFVESIMSGDKDITDRAVDLQTDMTSIVVTYTDRPSKVSGSVTDAQGAASPTAVVVAFPVDRKLWSGYGSSPRNLKSAVTSRTGVYTFNNLPPGDYNVIAIDPAVADGWRDPATLEALADQAARLTVKAGDTEKTLDLRLKAIR